MANLPPTHELNVTELILDFFLNSDFNSTSHTRSGSEAKVLELLMKLCSILFHCLGASFSMRLELDFRGFI